MALGIPGELVHFFAAEGGHSLLIKGPSGAGKTLLALQLADELKDEFVPHYTGREILHTSLRSQFRPLADFSLRRGPMAGLASLSLQVVCPNCDGMVDVTSGMRPIEVKCPSCGAAQRLADRAELNRLIGDVEKGSPSIEIPMHLPEVETAYDVVDENFRTHPRLRTLLLIDTIDGLDAAYDIRAHRLVSVLQRDLVENTSAGLVLIAAPGAESKLDHLVDGVVALAPPPSGSPYARILSIEKLRGRKSGRHRYVLVLHDGRFWEGRQFILDRTRRYDSGDRNR